MFTQDSSLKLSCGTVVRFGEGIHKLDESRLHPDRITAFPTDITLVGAGMDLTLLRIGDISLRSDAVRLSFRNLTLDCENDGLFDMRTGKLICDLENVRVVRFDAGHGGPKVFSAREGCVARAVNCRFEGGYGRSPGAWGSFLLASDPILARFEGCTFDGIWVRDTGSQGRVVYQGCHFIGYDPKLKHTSFPTLSFLDCTITEAPKGRPVRKPLNDLLWGSEQK